MKTLCLSLLTTVLAAMLIVWPAQALTGQELAACQDGCNSQYLNTVNTLWQAPRPAATAPDTYRQQVMTALNTLNQCMAACVTATTPAPPPATATNLAINRTASATRQQSGYEAAKAVDGNATSYWWANSTSTQSIRVDLGSSTSISKVSITWGSYYARSYQVQTSTDGSNWTTVASLTSATGGVRDHAFTARTARHVRISCSTASSSSGYAIKELSIFR